jgi:HPt (histidine-containing phosphotransfer) domain-containing protein
MDEKLIKKLERLQSAYIKALPEKVCAIESSWHSLLAEWSSKNIENLDRLAHNLYGTAGTYGCHAVSELALQIEVQVRQLPLTAGADLQAAKDKIDEYLATLKTLLD